MPIIVSEPQGWQGIRRTLAGKTLGFVPTMGNLHDGHAALCARAVAENDVTVASVFVNPAQFNDRADFEKYQRTFEADCALLERAGVAYVFHPAESAMYPDGYEVQVSETAISCELEGAFRPGHFTGMLTVVLKLLNIIGPTRAYFGEKDFQQLLLVEKMVSALFLPVEIVRCPTVRAASGLALSSRNGRLDADRREKAARISRLLESGLDDEAVMEKLAAEGFKAEYVATRWGRRLAAAWLDGVRLIDNVPEKERGEEKNAVVS